MSMIVRDMNADPNMLICWKRTCMKKSCGGFQQDRMEILIGTRHEHIATRNLRK